MLHHNRILFFRKYTGSCFFNFRLIKFIEKTAMALCGVVHGYLIALLNSQSCLFHGVIEWLIYSYWISLKTCFCLNLDSKFSLKVLLYHNLNRLYQTFRLPKSLQKYPEFLVKDDFRKLWLKLKINYPFWFCLSLSIKSLPCSFLQRYYQTKMKHVILNAYTSANINHITKQKINKKMLWPIILTVKYLNIYWFTNLLRSE